MEGLLVGLGIGTLVIALAVMFFSLAGITGAVILLCLVIKEKGDLKIRGIDESGIKKIVNLSIWSLVITIISCLGCTFAVLPILALVFANSNSKTALRAGNAAEALKKADLALLMLIISNSVIIGSGVLNTITSVVTSIVNV